MKWITASDIANWANTQSRRCQDSLPELISRLILAHTGNNVDHIHFPSGDSVTTGGWDGLLKTPVVFPFFPEGSSGWEMGVQKTAQAKAETDYNNRTNDPREMVPADSTFVFVTPRVFAKKNEWRKTKKTLEPWKDVKVIAVDDLEQWLSITPATALWLARKMGKVISDGIRDLEDVWEEWSVGTKPVMTPELVIGGRVKNIEAVQRWITNQPDILELQGDDPEEAYAFLYSSIATLPNTQKTQALSRCVVVENANDLRQLTKAFSNYPLIIAGPGECLKSAPAAVAKGHHVFIAMDATVVDVRGILRLARPQSDILEKVLHKNGLSEARAQKSARDSGQSIPVLRRQLFRSRAVTAPGWTKSESARILLPVLLANSWDEQKDGDRKAIETLTNLNYKSFVKGLTPFLSMEDAPLRKVGSIWMIKSPLDAWYLLAPHLTQDQLGRFKKTLLNVLTKTDPKYHLEADKRWAAAIYGKSSPYSGWLRTGMVESLALLAVHGSQSPSTASTQLFADSITREILSKADKWEVWASLKDASPLLAEASPNAFIEAVDERIAKNPSVFRELMKGEGGLFNECKHSGLLWSLESIAWSKEHIARAVNALAKLADIDLGGGWSNRPINSLGEVFLPGLPQTHATAKQRIEVLKVLIGKYPILVWKFAERFYSGGGISESHRFRWRDTGGHRRGLEYETVEEQEQYLNELMPLLEDLACRKENIISSLGDFTHLHAGAQKKLLATLEATRPSAFLRKERAVLLQKIREVLHWINSYGEDDLKAQTPVLSEILKKFLSKNVIERVGWLLMTPWPELPEGEPREYEAKDSAIKAAQKEAARQILDQASLKSIFKFASKIEYQGVLGHCLGKVVRDKNEDGKVLKELDSHATDMPMLVRGYALGRVETKGEGWIEDEIKYFESHGGITPETTALLFLGLPECAKTWALVEAQGKKIESVYWKYASGYSQTDKKQDATIAIQKLLRMKRPRVALNIAGDPQANIQTELLVKLLEEVLSSHKKSLDGGAMDTYHLANVFNQLYKRSEIPVEEMAKLEWPFVPIFDEIKRHTSHPMALHRVLQSDPGFFTKLVVFACKRSDGLVDSDKDKLDNESKQRRANAAYKVLRDWSLVPGTNADGTIEQTALKKWILDARKLCKKAGRTIGGDMYIGFMLAHAPTDLDGTWPNKAIRNLIENLANTVIEKHIENQVFNSRRVVARELKGGGNQERMLAEKYDNLSSLANTQWPRTAAMLRSIAQHYEDEAKYHDTESDLRDLRFG